MQLAGIHCHRYKLFSSTGVAKLFDEQICHMYENPTRTLRDGDPKFCSAAFRDDAARESTESKIIPAHKPRVNAKLERMVDR